MLQGKMEADKNTVSRKTSPLRFLVLILILFLTYRFLISPITKKINVIEASAQIISVDSKYYGMGTASKSWDETNTAFNVTAFLDKPKTGQFYYVYLKGNGGDLKDMILGKMELAGDVYSINYSSNKNIFGYKDLFITLETETDANSGKVGTPILSGSFNK